MNTLLDQIVAQCRPFTAQGHTATYIPELACRNPDQLGIYMISKDGSVSHSGDSFQQFTMQSVVKPMILLLALMDSGMDRVRELVGVEATGKPFDTFNYSDQALTGAHINPMVNTGAIALCTLIKGSSYAEKFHRLLTLTRVLSDNPLLDIDHAVYRSEKATGNKNRALAYMLKAYGMVHDPVEDVLDCYFRACSISVNCRDLANIAFVLANRGKDINTEERLFPRRYATYVNAIMTTCGMYDGSGEFALNVGVPAKSGVGGGIMAVVPTDMGIGIFAPALDSKGNSLAGIQMLERMSKRMYLSIF